ncbi:hypothetical protein PSACC_00057 [Paramicrosporidium saccamoebae]|uniref:Uncharacterized protein n=1 Tax=Paramicrosporidium saccamoebae TaxID=1246581 RepID=A0A2H9TQU4_9FUNG|nr:hypothetical protein PSACC_00057 [Paramicrosporidium saccamoebae]
MIFGVVAAAAGGLGAFVLAWKKYNRTHPWGTLAGLVLSIVTVFCGTVAAAGSLSWAYGVGAGVIIAIRDYGELDASCISELPIVALKRVFASMTAEHAVRLAWQAGVLGKEMQHDFTLNALHRLGSRRAKTLRLLLVKEHVNDPWVMKALMPLEDGWEKLPTAEQSHPKDLKPKSWRANRNIEECRFCGYRPSTGSGPRSLIYASLRSVFSWARRCRVCRRRTIKIGLREVPDEDFEPQEDPFQEDFGLQELFGDN